MNENEAKILDAIIAGKNEDEIKKAFEDAIKARQNNISRLNAAVANVQSVASQIKEKGGEGAYIRDGVLYKKSGVKVELKPKTFEFATSIDSPASKELRSLQQQIAAKEAEIAEIERKLATTDPVTSKVKKYTAEQVEEQLAKDKEELAKLTAAREEAYKKLEDVTAKSEEELRKAFHEGLGEGVTDKASYQEKQAQKKLESLTEKYAEKCKRRFGFAEHANWKIGAVAAGAAVVIGGLFSLLAPKDQA